VYQFIEAEKSKRRKVKRRVQPHAHLPAHALGRLSRPGTEAPR
jgi:hypothetical protein